MDATCLGYDLKKLLSDAVWLYALLVLRYLPLSRVHSRKSFSLLTAAERKQSWN
jgi:hypothetical protein